MRSNKGKTKRNMAYFLAVTMMGSSLVPMDGTILAKAAEKLQILSTEGGMENAAISWKQADDADGYNVYYKKNGENVYTQIDGELIRKYSDEYRADIPGISQGDYEIDVVPLKNGKLKTEEAASTNTKVVSNVREGFAFSKESKTKGEASGGYNNTDGTLPKTAQVLYITKDNVNTVSLDVIINKNGTKQTVTGLANILNARKKGYDKTSLVIRFIGNIKKEDVDGLNSNGYLEIKGCSNITLEGIGEDATITGIGFLVRECTNVEVRNLGFMLFPDDGVSLDTGNENIWVHNNDIFYGTAGSDADQAKGDGSCDIKGTGSDKKSNYITVSYNHFWDSGKCSLCGMNDTEEFFVTYHHNWFDHSDSRHPRIRVGSVHIYNNYYDGNAKYGVGVTKGASAFVEKNVFRNCKYPMLSSMQGTDIASGKGTFSSEDGGLIKAFDNQISGEKAIVYASKDQLNEQNDAYLAQSREEQVPDSLKTVQGQTVYNNFDTSDAMYQYQPDDTSKVTERVTSYAGRFSSGDFKWNFTQEDDTSYAINQSLMDAIKSYETKLTEVGANSVSLPYEPSSEETTKETTTKETTTTEETTAEETTEEATTAEETTAEETTEEATTTKETTEAVTTKTVTETTAASVTEDNIENQMDVGTMDIGGGGFVSGIVTGKKAMYARTDVGGAYRYNFETERWEQMLGFLSEEDRGLLSVDAMCIDPKDDNAIYLLCGCAYFSGAKTVIFRSKDGGYTFDEIDVTDMIQVHGNGYGRQFGEAIAVDPDDSNIIYCGGDTTGLIKSTDGGDHWSIVKGYSDLGLFTYEINWPTWTDHKVKTTDKEYSSANGIGTVAIIGNKVYVGTSVKGEANVHVADIGTDEFSVLSDKLPTDLIPSRINTDADGNLLISYVNGIAFDGNKGAAYKYDVKTGEVTDISPKDKENAVGIGAVVSEPDNADHLVATTCGLWWGQLWGPNDWEENKVCYGDIIFKSKDGGKNWTVVAAGNKEGWPGTLTTNYLQDGGHDWIKNKAIHWSGALVLDPVNKGKIYVTSGNGVFACDDIWADVPTMYFHPDGIEEVVSLDATSAPDGTFYSVIGDYDGFIHTDVNHSTQLTPSMNTLESSASTGAIAYCPSNPDVMVRYSEKGSGAFYSKDAGTTWEKLKSGGSGGKAAITQLDENTYRIFRTGSGSISYTDDFGESWKNAEGTEGSSNLWACVDEKNPKYVYAYGYYFNAYYNGHDKGQAPTIDDARYTLMVSDDYGKTFTKQTICLYDQCDSAYRIAYLDEGEFVLAGGWQGAYLVQDYGKTVTKLDSVSYCKTIGSGAPEKEGGCDTLYMWGKPDENSKEGVYRSTDKGKTWVAVNLSRTYGGTGNGNYIVGDKKQFGTFYMSTVGCGIVYARLKTNSDPSTNIPVTGVTIEEDAVAMQKDGTYQLKYKVAPVNATNKDVIFTSSNPEVAVVDEKGLITAVGIGSADITVITKDGNKSATCKVTVVKEDTPIETTTEVPSEEVPTTSRETETTTEVPSEEVPTTSRETETTTEGTSEEVPTTSRETETTTEGTSEEVPTTSREAETTTEGTSEEVPTTSREAETTTEGTSEEVPTTTSREAETTTKEPSGEVPTTSREAETTTEEPSGEVPTTSREAETTTEEPSGEVPTTSREAETTTEEPSGEVPTTSREAETATEEPSGEVPTTSRETETTTEEPSGEVPTTSKEAETTTEEPSGEVPTTSKEAETTGKSGQENPTTNIPAGGNTSILPTTPVSNTVEQLLEINRKTANIIVGKTKTVRAKVSPANSDQTVQFISLDKKIATVSNSGAIKGMKPGITTIIITTKSGIRKTVAVTVRPAKVQKVKKSSVKATSVKLKWKKQKNISGYIVYFNSGTSKRYRYYKTVKKNTITIKKLKKNTSYRFKVRAYKKVNEKITGACSEAVKVKTKQQ